MNAQVFLKDPKWKVRSRAEPEETRDQRPWGWSKGVMSWAKAAESEPWDAETSRAST